MNRSGNTGIAPSSVNAGDGFFIYKKQGSCKYETTERNKKHV